MNWLKGFLRRRRLEPKPNPFGFIPSVDFIQPNMEYCFTGEDGVTKIDIETDYHNGRLYFHLPVGKPIYLYYKGVK